MVLASTHAELQAPSENGFENADTALRSIGAEATKRVEAVSEVLTLGFEQTKETFRLTGDTNEKEDLRKKTIDETMLALGSLVDHRRKLSENPGIRDPERGQLKEAVWINDLFEGTSFDPSVDIFHRNSEALDLPTTTALSRLEMDADPLTALRETVNKVYIPTKEQIDSASTELMFKIQTIVGTEAGNAVAYLIENKDVIDANPEMQAEAELIWADVRELATASVFYSKSIRAVNGLQKQLTIALATYTQTNPHSDTTRRWLR